jgi:hypothetical protein
VNFDLRGRTVRKVLATQVDAAAAARLRRQVSANASVSLGVVSSSPRIRRSRRRKNGHTAARDARTECSEITTLARVAVGRSGERFRHTGASPFLDIVLERQYSAW